MTRRRSTESHVTTPVHSREGQNWSLLKTFLTAAAGTGITFVGLNYLFDFQDTDTQPPIGSTPAAEVVDAVVEETPIAVASATPTPKAPEAASTTAPTKKEESLQTVLNRLAAELLPPKRSDEHAAWGAIGVKSEYNRLRTSDDFFTYAQDVWKLLDSRTHRAEAKQQHRLISALSEPITYSPDRNPLDPDFQKIGMGLTANDWKELSRIQWSHILDDEEKFFVNLYEKAVQPNGLGLTTETENGHLASFRIVTNLKHARPILVAQVMDVLGQLDWNDPQEGKRVFTAEELARLSRAIVDRYLRQDGIVRNPGEAWDTDGDRSTDGALDTLEYTNDQKVCRVSLTDEDSDDTTYDRDEQVPTTIRVVITDLDGTPLDANPWQDRTVNADGSFAVGISVDMDTLQEKIDEEEITSLAQLESSFYQHSAHIFAITEESFIHTPHEDEAETTSASGESQRVIYLFVPCGEAPAAPFVAPTQTPIPEATPVPIEEIHVNPVQEQTSSPPPETEQPPVDIPKSSNTDPEGDGFCVDGCIDTDTDENGKYEEPVIMPAAPAPSNRDGSDVEIPVFPENPGK